MSACVLILSVFAYFVANIFQNKMSATLQGRTYPSSYFQMLWMGLAGVAIFFYEFCTDGVSFSAETLGYGSMAGTISLLGGVCLLSAMALGSLSLTILIFSMYIVVPPVLAVIFLGEPVTVCQIIGIILIIIVIALTNFKKEETGSKKASTLWWLLSIGSALCTGLSSYIMKVHQTAMPGMEEREYTVVSYLTGFVVAFIFATIFRTRELKKGAIPYVMTKAGFFIPAVGVAVAQGCAMLCNMYNASRLPAIILYPVSQLATLMLTTVYGIIFLKEKCSKLVVCCLSLGTIAIILMNF